MPPWQTVCAEPALAVGVGFAVMTTVEVTSGQGPDAVKVSVTVPVVMVGVYVEVTELGFEKDPVEADQVELVALPPILPERFTIVPEHTV